MDCLSLSGSEIGDQRERGVKRGLKDHSAVQGFPHRVDERNVVLLRHRAGHVFFGERPGSDGGGDRL